MPRTRHASPGSPLRQERWASSPAHPQGLKANLVARRCEALADPELRRLVWEVQARSHDDGGLPALVADMVRLAPSTLCATVSNLYVDWLAQFCLDPAADVAESFLIALRACSIEYAQRQASAVVTSVGRTVHSSLEYALEQRCLVVVEGVARIGKTFSAAQWCEARPGRVRYVQCPSTNDDVAFFTAIAKALGLTVEHNPKAKSLRPRIEDTLQGGDLMLVLDEAHYAWPGHSYRNSRPSRICWLMTALVNYDVPVALIVTPQFFRSQKVCEDRIGWACEQLVGRIGDYVKLPEELSMEDLRAVARAHLPEGDPKSIEALALYAGSSQKYLAAIEHAVKKARYLAGKAGRDVVTQSDLRTAIESGLVPSDSALAGAMRNLNPAHSRDTGASAPPNARGTIGRETVPATVNRLAGREETFVSRKTPAMAASD